IQEGKNGRYKANKVSFYRFGLLNSGIYGVFDKLSLGPSEYSQLKQSPGNDSILIKEKNRNIELVDPADKARSTIIWGGIFPFVTLPGRDVENQESFISEDSVSFFWYFKKKF
ncbi:MAG: hypothetical protein ACRENF_02210, partial [Thermodesulfobacteriota bacterium]